MTIVVEDGTSLPNANSYVAVADVDAYWAARNGTAWAAATPAAKSAYVLEAALYLDYTFRWRGSRVRSTQTMGWPRAFFWLDGDERAVSSTSVPQRVKDAQCILANEAISGPLMASLPRGGRVQSESVGPLSRTYFADAPGSKKFPMVAALLRDLTTSNAVTTDAVLG